MYFRSGNAVCVFSPFAFTFGVAMCQCEFPFVHVSLWRPRARTVRRTLGSAESIVGDVGRSADQRSLLLAMSAGRPIKPISTLGRRQESSLKPRCPRADVKLEPAAVQAVGRGDVKPQAFCTSHCQMGRRQVKPRARGRTSQKQNSMHASLATSLRRGQGPVKQTMST